MLQDIRHLQDWAALFDCPLPVAALRPAFAGNMDIEQFQTVSADHIDDTLP